MGLASLTGGGELGELTRNYDWAKSPLGPIGAWPVSLRVQVQLMLNSRFPMLIFWGPELVTFYNDAFRPSLGDDGKHPGSLGQPGAESWAESWPVIGPMIHNIMGGGDAVWFEDQKLPIWRDGAMGYAYWTYSFSAITADDGAVNGILVTCSETTKAVESIQELAESKDRFEISIETAELAVWDVDPETNIITVNRRLREWFGLGPAEEVPLELAVESIAAADRERVMESINRAMQYQSGGRYDIEYLLDPPSGAPKRTIHAKGRALFREDGTCYRFNGTLRDVSEQVLARQKITETNNEIRAMLESAPFPIGVYIGRELRIRFANQSIKNVFGKGNDVEGKLYPELLPELAGQGIFEQLRGVLDSGVAYHSGTQRVDIVRDGLLQPYYFNYSFTPLFDPNGNVYGVMNTAAEVTELEMARQETIKSEARLRTLINDAPVSIVAFLGERFMIDQPNQAFFDLVNKGPEIAGLPLEEAIPELTGENAGLLQIAGEVYRTGEPFRVDAAPVQVLRDGAWTEEFYNISLSPLRNPDGSIYGVLDISVDVTKGVRAMRLLLESEETLSEAIDLAELATWSIDAHTGAITYSDRLQQWLGVTQGEFGSKNASRVLPADQLRIHEALRRALSEPNGTFDEIYTIVHAQTGKLRIIRAVGKTTENQEGEVTGLAGAAQDITIQRDLQFALEQEVQSRTEELGMAMEETRAANEELADANERLTQSNEELAQYAYVASHDLQEPLRKIQVFAGMLSGQQDLSEKSKNFTEKITASAERMRQLIGDLLNFSRLLQSDNEFQPVDLGQTVSTVLEDFELIIKDTDAQIDVAPLPMVIGVKLQMNQLFYNLVGNALKFRKPGTRPHVSITSRRMTGSEAAVMLPMPVSGMAYHQVCVRDNGIGFDPQYAGQIFEVFKRLHGKDVYPGSGIGLSLCRKIAENHGGAISVDSEANVGSTFCLIIPERQVGR